SRKNVGIVLTHNQLIQKELFRKLFFCYIISSIHPIFFHFFIYIQTYKIKNLFKIYLIICLCFFLVITALNFRPIALLSFENLPCSASKITYKHFYNTNLNRL